MKTLILSSILALSSVAFANHDGSDIPACKGVTDVCMAANGTGFKPGDHKKNGQGLWADCVAKLAHGKTVAGVTGVSEASAKACLDAEKATHKKK